MTIDNKPVKSLSIVPGTKLIEAVYGDSCTGDTKISTINGDIKIETLFNNGYGLRTYRGKEFVSTDISIYNFDGKKIVINNIKYIIRHRTIKKKYILRDSSGNEVIVTEDHSLIILDDKKMKIIKPQNIKQGQTVINLNNISRIEKCECIGQFNNEYVYDIEVDTKYQNQHNFFGNNILIHNTDSTYFCYEGLLNTIEGIEDMSIQQKAKFLADFNTKFLDHHNREFMNEYYAERHCKSVHNFELETIGTGVWLDVKKRYAQEIYWKDGKMYDHPKLKVKGLEMVKGSYPKIAREMLKKLTITLLESDDKNLIHILNRQMQELKQEYFKAPIEQLCPASSANNYTKYIINDEDPQGLKVAPKCPAVIRGLGYYNWIRNTKHLIAEPVYGGKVKYYTVKTTNRKTDTDIIFCFQPGAYPKWAEEIAPINKESMFQKCVLDPFNRILEPSHYPLLRIDGSLQISLFDQLM